MNRRSASTTSRRSMSMTAGFRKNLPTARPTRWRITPASITTMSMQMMSVLVPSARYRKGHYAYGKFTVPEPHGLHTDHSAEDPAGAGEPICIARIETLGTHYLAGDYTAHDPETQSMLKALRYWIAVPEGEPEHILDELLKRRDAQDHSGQSRHADGRRQRFREFPGHPAHRRPAARRRTAFGVLPEAIQAQVRIYRSRG